MQQDTLANDIVARACVCCCTLRWCEDVKQSVLMRLPEGGLAYLHRKSILKINNGNATLDKGLKKGDHYNEESRLYLGVHHFLPHAAESDPNDPERVVVMAKAEVDGTTRNHCETAVIFEALGQHEAQRPAQTAAELQAAAQKQEDALRRLVEVETRVKVLEDSPYDVSLFLKRDMSVNGVMWKAREMKSITGLTAQEFGALFELFNFDDKSFEKLSFHDSSNTFRAFDCRTPESKHKQTLVAMNALLMTLVTCYTGLSYTAVSGLFGKDRRTVSRCFSVTVLWGAILFCSFCTAPPSAVVRAAQPECMEGISSEAFVKYFIDCYQLGIERSADIALKAASYSEYKAKNTAKVQTMVTPSGWLAGASEAFLGRTPDDNVFLMSRVLDELQTGEAAEVDRGYTSVIKAAAERGIRLIAPTNKRRASNAEGEKKSKKRRREDNDKALGIEESLKSQGTANRRIIVEHWNSVVERWALARRVHHDQTHMVTYIQWFIHLLAVLTEPPHPVTRGG